MKFEVRAYKTESGTFEVRAKKTVTFEVHSKKSESRSTFFEIFVCNDQAQ